MKHRTSFVAAAGLFAAALSSSSFAPRLDHWTIIGPGGGGAQFLPTISPHDPRRVLVSCDMTGSYISDDAGASWRMFNLRDRARFFVFDPKDRDTIYVGANGIYRSVDAGRTWRLVHPTPAKVRALRMPDDHAECELASDDVPTGRVTAMAIDHDNSEHLYAAFTGNGSSDLYESKDRGASWTKIAALSNPAQHVVAAGSEVRAVGADFVATCRGGHCESVKTPARFIDASAAASAIYGVSQREIFVSRDAGNKWTAARLPGDGATLAAIAASAEHPETAYVSYSGLKDAAGTWFGVARTADYGATWNLVWKENSSPAPNIHDAWLTARFGPSWSGNPLSLGVAPTDPNIVYGGDYGRTMRSLDGGRTWNAVYSTRMNGGAFTTNGMDVTTCYGVHFDPFDRNRMFISYTDIGLFRSDDGGRSWASATRNGVPRQWLNTTYWVAFDPDVRGRMWAAMSGTHDLPRPKMWRRTSVQKYRGGVVVSDDGGATWRVAGTGMENTAATHILLDPRSPRNARVLYVAGFGRGVYKSSDGGKTWALKNTGLPGPEPFAWRLAEDRTGALYVILARRSEDGSFGNSADGGLYRSRDGAGHWERIKLPEGVNGPNGLAIDPQDDKRIYVAAWGRKDAQGAVDGGIFFSTDGGSSWRNVLKRDQHVYDVTIDPQDPNVLYACGFESSAWRSTDRGATWTRIGGYNFKWGHRVIPDPMDHSKIFVTTFGGSVWHGPAAGDPTAAEDIATPQIAYTK